LQIGVDWDRSAAAHLRCLIAQFEHRADFAAGVKDHIPCQFGDFAGAKTGFDRQQYDETVAKREAGMIGEKEKIVDMIGRKNLGLLTRHCTSNQFDTADSKAIESSCNENSTTSNCIAFAQNLISSSAWHLRNGARAMFAGNISQSVGTAK
jgi:hypothetical protein